VVLPDAAAIVTVPFAVAVEPVESTTAKVMLAAVPITIAVGVPVIAPVDAFSVRPAGSLPEPTENVYGDSPPVAVSEAVNAVPTFPLALGNVKVRGAAVTVRVIAAVWVIPLPVAVTVIG
jgi:hypothetical protein